MAARRQAAVEHEVTLLLRVQERVAESSVCTTGATRRRDLMRGLFAALGSPGDLPALSELCASSRNADRSVNVRGAQEHRELADNVRRQVARRIETLAERRG